MLKTKEILRLKFETGLSVREIGKACNCGKTTVSELLKRAQDTGITWPTELTDKQLMSALYPPTESRSAPAEPDMEYTFREMKKKHVTLMLLWEEYKDKHPDGVMYTQFCDRYRKFKKQNNLSMHKEHKAGEEIEVDWAGSTMSYTYPATGEERTAYIFVSVLPASNYPFAYAYVDMKMPNWIDAHVRAFEYYGGVPKITISDNPKTAVTTPDLVDPVLNKTYHEMARHYGTTLVPARPGKPKDKAADEGMVGIVSRKILAALRNRQFFSLQEINEAIQRELVKLLNRPFQKREGNRQAAFEAIDKPCLQPLPKTKFEYSDWKETKIQFNYHVDYDGFFYSCHFSYASQRCSIRATARMIEVYIGTERIATHLRNYNTYKRYTTLEEHMPEEHKAVSGWNSDRFLSWAAKIGPNTHKLIKNILGSREYPVQTYRACMGVMRLSKSYTAELMEKASREALEKNVCSYKYFSMMLKQIAKTSTKIEKEKIIQHDNVRGSSAYEGGGIRA